jgi:hypothetical protein
VVEDLTPTLDQLCAGHFLAGPWLHLMHRLRPNREGSVIFLCSINLMDAGDGGPGQRDGPPAEEPDGSITQHVSVPY